MVSKINKLALALLAWSGVSVPVLLMVNVADTVEVAPQQANQVSSTTTAPQTIQAPSLPTPEYPSVSSSESVEELAIAKEGCDCPGCRNQARQLLMQSRLGS